MTEADKTYDQRQYKLMLESVRDYCVNDGVSMTVSDLGTLVRRLDALLAVLRETPAEWKHSFQGKVNILAEVNGMLLYQEKTQLDEAGRNIVGETVNELNVLIQAAIDTDVSQ